MPLPEFTRDEQYLIDYMKSPQAAGICNSYMWSYVICGAIIAGFAAYSGSIPMMVAAFVVVCGFRIYEERHQSHWVPLWRSIIDKFEAACVERSEKRSDESGEC